tara:strand:+ start:1057 stop:1476 length:420 start_codon:yes stop_codon:yes gene_type:complete
MSKTSDALLLYANSKEALYLGMGYLFATNRQQFARIAWKILVFHTKEAGGQLAFYGKEIIGKEIVKPEIQRTRAWWNSQKPSAKAPGTIFTAGSWLPMILIGGHTAMALDSVYENLEIDEVMADILDIETAGVQGDGIV